MSDSWVDCGDGITSYCLECDSQIDIGGETEEPYCYNVVTEGPKHRQDKMRWFTENQELMREPEISERKKDD